VLLSSHVLAEVEASCDRAVLIDRGQTVAQGTLDELRGLGAASEAVELECDRDASAALGALGAVERATSTALAGGWWRVGLELRRGADASDTCGAAGRALRDAGIAVRRIERAPVELESVFHRILAAGARR
jgi:ABC-2 type transport system ATP-binding protein